LYPYIVSTIHLDKPISETNERANLETASERISQAKKRYLGNHFWATGYGVWSTGNITDEMVQTYLEHHRSKEDDDDSEFILE